MPHHTLTTASSQAHAVVEDYLAELAARLPGPRGARAAVVAEIGDGLYEATAGHAVRGLTPLAAARAAVAEFGTPDEVAAAFVEELATAQARRTVCAFLATGPLVGVWWLLLLAPEPWRHEPSALWTAIPALPLVAIGSLAALTAVVTTGRLTRWLPATTPRQAVTAAALTGLACLAGDLAVLATLAFRTAATTASLPWALGATAATGSAIRMLCSQHVVRHCLQTRRTIC